MICETMAGDNRFEIIAKAKHAILEGTNIDTSEDEMKVLDNFLFRCWQMGWLDKYDDSKPKTEWIPVSERLPDIGDTYLVTVMVGKEISTDVADSFGSYIDGFWDTFNDWIEDEECHVIAWMPLPEPYKGGEEK